MAAAVGYVALCGFDRVSVHIFPEPDPAAPNVDAAALSAEMAARGGLRAVRGRKSALQFFQNLSQLTARGAANLNEALRRGALASRQAGVAVVLSDFLDPAGYESGLERAGRARLPGQRRSNPRAGGIRIAGSFGDLRLVDCETGGMQEVTFGKYRLKAYQQTVQNFCQRLREFCQGRGMSFFSVSSETPLEQLLLKQLRQAEVWG